MWQNESIEPNTTLAGLASSLEQPPHPPAMRHIRQFDPGSGHAPEAADGCISGWSHNVSLSEINTFKKEQKQITW